MHCRNTAVLFRLVRSVQLLQSKIHRVKNVRNYQVHIIKCHYKTIYVKKYYNINKEMLRFTRLHAFVLLIKSYFFVVVFFRSREVSSLQALCGSSLQSGAKKQIV